MLRLRSIWVYLSVGFLTSPLWGQGHYLAEQPSRTSLDAYGDRLSLRLTAEGFFRNNEYASDLIADYTLPGYRLSVDLGFRPDTQLPIELRVGVGNIYYWGALRYPSAIAYQDVPSGVEREDAIRDFACARSFRPRSCLFGGWRSCWGC